MSRMFDRFANGQLATGTITLNHGIVVSAVTLGYKHGVDRMDQITDGVESLWQLGVRGVLFPRPTMIVQYFYETTLARVRDRLKDAYP